MIYIIIGRRGTGKTTLGYTLACGKGRRSIYDPRREFSTSPSYDFLLPDDADRPEMIVTPEHSAAGEFPAFCSVIKEWIDDDPEIARSVLVDETRFVKRVLLETPSFDYILRCSDRQKVNVIFTAHRPSDLPVDVRAIADTWCVFQSTQEHDLEVLRERCGDDFAAKVQTLGEHQFMSWDDSRAVATAYLDPRVWYVPLRPVVASSSTGEGDTA